MSLPEEKQKPAVGWFEANPSESKVPSASTRKLLETYSGIPSEEVFSHVVKVRDEAWSIFPYPCIGQFRFLEPSFAALGETYFGEVVQRLRDGQALLDMACCFGQTVRELVAGGAPAENTYGCDLRPEFIDLGYKLFRDQDKLQTKFLVADIFDPESALKEVKGQVDIIFAGSFFHLWGYKQQLEVSKAVAQLLRAKPGSMILGRQIGSIDAEERVNATGNSYEQNELGTMYRHNIDSFKQLWKEIGDELGISFTVEAGLKKLSDDYDWHTDNTRLIWFVVRRE